MALRQEQARLLIADDVGVGKTIEAAMIARELLDRGLARRLAVICPAHLCDQWQMELHEKFALDAAVVQPATIGRLERTLPRNDIGIYHYYQHLVVSIDFIKSDRNRLPFLENAPDLIIVDEAHIAARPPGQVQRAQHQRYELVRQLAQNPERHLLLVTATPHSGVEESFRSLLGLLNREFDVPEQGGESDLKRRQLVPFVVQRRRVDLQDWLGTDTPFPQRRAEERSYHLSPAYHRLFDDVLAYCRETVQLGAELRRQQQRVRHWAAIALLRCVLSSPAAATAVLGNRARGQGIEVEQILADEERFESEGEIDAAYRPQVLDPLEEGESGDYVPTAPLEDAEPTLSTVEKGKLSTFLRQAGRLAGAEEDRKLSEAVRAVGDMLREGFRPIVFCRFIATAKYLEGWLPKLLGKEFAELRVVAVTGEIGDEERSARIEELVQHDRRVLVATDCLSEGINLQEHFDAVLHYDLPWNPNRLEQREGRVDRFGQKRPDIKTVVLYGADNQVDLVVLDVLIKKARAIRQQLGIAVPVPAESDQVIQAVVDSVLLRGRGKAGQLQLAFTDPEVSRLHSEWERAAQKEGEQRAFFRQQGIQPDEVACEIDATDPVLGDPATVQRFLANAAQRLGGTLRPTKRVGIFELELGDMGDAVANLVDGRKEHGLRVTFDPLQEDGALYLNRTHPMVAAYCDTVLGKALGLEADERFARCGAIVTNAVSLRTAIILLRMRYLLRDAGDGFAEEILLAGFQRRDGQLTLLKPMESAARDLLQTARPVANLAPDERSEQVDWALAFLQRDERWFEPIVHERAAQLQESNQRLRSLVRARPLEIMPHTPPDILGCYVLLPGGRA
jgi:superfamily II DNA or RNA helicase